MKFEMRFKNIKNMPLNGQILKIYSYVNFSSKCCSLTLQQNFVINTFVPYQYIRSQKQKEKHKEIFIELKF